MLLNLLISNNQRRLVGFLFKNIIHHTALVFESLVYFCVTVKKNLRKTLENGQTFFEDFIARSRQIFALDALEIPKVKLNLPNLVFAQKFLTFTQFECKHEYIPSCLNEF